MKLMCMILAALCSEVLFLVESTKVLANARRLQASTSADCNDFGITSTIACNCVQGQQIFGCLKIDGKNCPVQNRVKDKDGNYIAAYSDGGAHTKMAKFLTDGSPVKQSAVYYNSNYKDTSFISDPGEELKKWYKNGHAFQSDKYMFVTDNAFQCNAQGSATGDPHLSNIHGKKFDVHDGLHRLVHIPRGASEEEALLKIDADATMMPGQISCYNVYFTSARISGKWVRKDVLFQHNNDPMGQKKFLLGFGGKFHEWSELVRHASKLNFSGIEPVKVSTNLRTASRDAPGGRDIQLRIGHRNPVLVQIWASKGQNELSGEVDIQYLNLEVSNLPQNTGGLLGLDMYNRPADSKCGLTKEDSRAIQSISDLVLLSLNHTQRLHWRMSAHMRK